MVLKCLKIIMCDNSNSDNVQNYPEMAIFNDAMVLKWLNYTKMGGGINDGLEIANLL